MRNQSAKFRARAAEVRPFRKALIQRVGHCEVCGHDPNRVRPGMIAWEMCCHEILNGPLRQKCLDKAHSLLVVCWVCNSERLTNKVEYPEARQLAILRASRPDDFDLAKHNALANPNAPNRVTLEEIDAW